jgi:protein tyrosine/serine phosphatase
MFGWIVKWAKSRSTKNPWDIKLRNLHEVYEGRLYRSAAPDAEALAELKTKLGIKTVVDLRGNRTHEERQDRAVLVQSLGMDYIPIPLLDNEAPDWRYVEAFLRLVQNQSVWPILVHCEGGRHRTGGLVAAARVLLDGWSVDRAFKEAESKGFYDALGHGAWQDFILKTLKAAEDAVPKEAR